MNRFDVATISIDDDFLFGYGVFALKLFSYMSTARPVIVATRYTNTGILRSAFSGN